MNIAGVTGLTEAQIANLKALGAVEFEPVSVKDYDKELRPLHSYIEA